MNRFIYYTFLDPSREPPHFSIPTILLKTSQKFKYPESKMCIQLFPAILKTLTNLPLPLLSFNNPLIHFIKIANQHLIISDTTAQVILQQYLPTIWLLPQSIILSGDFNTLNLREEILPRTQAVIQLTLLIIIIKRSMVFPIRIDLWSYSTFVSKSYSQHIVNY